MTYYRQLNWVYHDEGGVTIPTDAYRHACGKFWILRALPAMRWLNAAGVT